MPNSESLFVVEDPCCDICTGKRMGIERLLNTLVTEYDAKFGEDIREEICLAAKFLIRRHDESPVPQASRERLRHTWMRHEYARILAKFSGELQG